MGDGGRMRPKPGNRPVLLCPKVNPGNAAFSPRGAENAAAPISELSALFQSPPLIFHLTNRKHPRNPTKLMLRIAPAAHADSGASFCPASMAAPRPAGLPAHH